jgi:uncharacterized glyoxalase superfamily protein PhnB
MAETANPTFKPAAFYRDPLAALKWLEAAFGFETTTLVTDQAGKVGYSEMSFLGGVVSINSEFSGDPIGEARMVSPAAIEGRGTQFIRVHLPDGLDEHCERARAAGARIVQEPSDQFYGERTYRVIDPEGHVWNFAQPVAQVSIADQEAATGLKIRTSLEEAGHG